MALRNISAILKKAGGGLEHIVKVTGKPQVIAKGLSQHFITSKFLKKALNTKVKSADWPI